MPNPNLTLFQHAANQFPGEGRPNPIYGQLYQIADRFSPEGVSQFFVSNNVTNHAATGCPGITSTGQNIVAIPSGFEVVDSITALFNNCVEAAGQSMGDIYSNTSISPLSQDDFDCIRRNLVDATQSFCSNSNLVAIGVGIGLGIVFMVIAITILYPYYKNQSKPIDLEKQPDETQPLLEGSSNSINAEGTDKVTEIVDHTAGRSCLSFC